MSSPWIVAAVAMKKMAAAMAAVGHAIKVENVAVIANIAIVIAVLRHRFEGEIGVLCTTCGTTSGSKCGTGKRPFCGVGRMWLLRCVGRRKYP